MRLFTAISVPTDLREKIIQDTSLLRGRYPQLKWIRMGGLHITLNFFGEVEEKYLPHIESAMSTAASGLEEFDLRLQGLGFFPKRDIARVLYFGVGDGGDSCRALQKIITDQTSAVFPRDRRPYTPHLTLARIKERTKLPDPSGKEGIPVVSFRVKTLELYRSYLKSTGAEYEVLKSVELNALKG